MQCSSGHSRQLKAGQPTFFNIAGKHIGLSLLPPQTGTSPATDSNCGGTKEQVFKWVGTMGS